MLAFHHAFDDFFVPSLIPARVMQRAFRHQLHETKTNYQLTLTLPGIQPEDLKLACEDGILSIEGETAIGGQTHNVSHRLRLPRDSEVEAGKAVAENGILVLTLPKRHRPTLKLTVEDGNHTLPEAADTDYRLQLALPGMRPSDLKISCEEGVLRVEGETQMEHQHLRASEAYRLPPEVDFEAAVAAAENGILTILLPKRVTPSPRKIDIEVTRALPNF